MDNQHTSADSLPLTITKTAEKKSLHHPISRNLLASLGAVIFLTTASVHAATAPDLATSADYGILSSTYTNTAAGTTIAGDLGYTTGPAVAPTVSGTTYIAPAISYSTAGTDQGIASYAQPLMHAHSGSLG